MNLPANLENHITHNLKLSSTLTSLHEYVELDLFNNQT